MFWCSLIKHELCQGLQIARWEGRYLGGRGDGEMRPAYLTADISPGDCGSASLHSLVPQPWVPSIRAGQKGGNWFQNPLWEPQCPLCPLKTGTPSLGWQLQPGGGLGWRSVLSPVPPSQVHLTSFLSLKPFPCNLTALGAFSCRNLFGHPRPRVL